METNFISYRPKILYLITQGEYGGAQHYVHSLAKVFSEDYDVVVGFGEKEKSEKFIKMLEADQIRYYVIDELKRDISSDDDYKAFKAIRKIIKAEKPDIVHLNSSKISVLGTLAAIGQKCRVVYTAHGWVFNEKLSLELKSKYIRAEKFSAMLKDMIICVSEFDRLAAINNKIAPSRKLSVVHNGIEEFQILDKAEARRLIAERLGEKDLFSRYDFVIGSIGYLYKNKGYDFLINAAKIISKHGLKPLLLIIGDGPERDELDNWIDQLKLKDHVRILGETDNAARLLNAFDIYVCSSIKEGLSYTVIEAMTAGLPIVATNVGGNPELITDLKEGLIAAPNDVEDLAVKIIEILNNPERTESFAKAAKEKAQKDFNLKQMTQKTRYIYENLMSVKHEKDLDQEIVFDK